MSTTIWSPVPAAVAFPQCVPMIQDYLDRTKTQRYVQGPLDWFPLSGNVDQMLFILQNKITMAELGYIREREVEAIASLTADPINEFFATRKLPIVLEAWDDPSAFGIGGFARFSHRNVQKCFGKYRLFDRTTGHRFDTARGGVSYYESLFGSVGAVQMENGDTLYYMPDPHLAFTPFTLLDFVQTNLRNLFPGHYTGLVVPGWNIKENILDISVLTKMFTLDVTGGKWNLLQPKAASKWVVNGIGSEFKAGFAAECALEMAMSERDPEEGDLVFREDLIAALCRPGMTYPIAVGRIGSDDFAEEDPDLPGDDDSEF